MKPEYFFSFELGHYLLNIAGYVFTNMPTYFTCHYLFLSTESVLVPKVYNQTKRKGQVNNIYHE